jgi:hypothetical protein
MVKVLLSYDMVNGREEECQRYVMQTLAPGMAHLGLRLSDAWYTLWGENSPQILGGGLMDSSEQAAQMLNSDEWEALIDGLRPFVENLKIRVVEANGRIQL